MIAIFGKFPSWRRFCKPFGTKKYQDYLYFQVKSLKAKKINFCVTQFFIKKSKTLKIKKSILMKFNLGKWQMGILLVFAVFIFFVTIWYFSCVVSI